MAMVFPRDRGVLLCAHGSRDPDAVAEFACLAARFRERFPGVSVEYGYLEFANPVIRTALDRLYAEGVRHVLAMPCMLFAATHLKNDVPSVLNAYMRGHPEMRVEYGDVLGLDPKMMQAAAIRIREALSGADSREEMHRSALLCVGRGTSDPDANGNIAKVMRMLWEGLGFGWGQVAYSGMTFPLVGAALDHVVRSGYDRIVVVPYFLFTGILIRRIEKVVKDVSERYPGVEFVMAPYLKDHPLVIDSLVSRVQELVSGERNLHCMSCKYREKVLGFEDEVGLAQRSGHHHVEGIDVGDGGGHVHDHHHGCDPVRSGYPHGDHPLGPAGLTERNRGSE